MGRPWMLSNSIDLATLPDDLVRQLESTIENYERKENKARSWQEVLDHGTDEEILGKAASECDKGAPISFARNYKANWGREIVPYGLQDHPRRPVIMRGALYVRYANHSFTPGGTTPNGWAHEVYKRAIRMSKATLLDWEEVLNFTEELAARVGKLHPNVSYHFWRHLGPPRDRGKFVVLMKGRWVWLDHDQYRNVQMMQKVIRKAEKLEDRLALLKQARKEKADARA